MLKREDFKNIYLIDKVADEDMFHHSHFADSLWKYIKDNTVEQDKTPFNVGIFGKWGVGKSTVIKFFTKHLEEWNGDRKNNKKFKFIEFKVWKFSENALRRKFIFTIGKHILGQQKLNELYTEVKAKKTLLFPLIATPDYILKAFRNWKENFPTRLFGWLTLFSSIAFVSALILNYQMKWNLLKGLADVTALFWMMYSPTLLISVISYIFKSINEAKVEVAFDQFDSEEQFEERFGDLMESKKDEIKIIFIDDLDRCSKEKVIQTLETIKTYLDVPTCVFIIACDDAVICNVVRNKRSELCNEEGDGLEYLHKFFQHSIPIPPFIHQNMREYALQLLNKKENDLRKLPDVEEILRILIHTGVKTPRKAIAVINGFATDFEVVLRREEEKVLHPEYISMRLSTLAFFTAVKKDFRDFFDLLVTDSNLIKYVLRIEEGDLEFIEGHHKQLLKEIYLFTGEGTLETSYKDNKAKDFVLLIQSARDHLADVDDFSPFIYLKSDSSSIALSSERFRTLNSLLRDGITDKVRQMLTELKGEEDRRAHFSVIVKVLGDIQSTAELRKAYRTFFEIAELMPGDDNFRQTASTSAMIKFPDLTRANPKWLEEFEIKGVMFLLKYLRSGDQKAKALKELVNALDKVKDKELAKKWIKAILVYPELAPDQEVTRVKKILDRREAPAENKEAVFFTVIEICSFIKECQGNGVALNRFFVGKTIEDIAGAIIKLEEIEERDAAQEAERKTLVEAFEILDSNILSQKGHLPRRLKNFTSFLPTGEYYYEVVKKIPAIIPSLTQENSQGLLVGFVEEVPNVGGKAESLKELLSLIDEVSLKHNKPVDSLAPLVKSLSGIATEKFEGEVFEISTNYLTKFVHDGRISEETAQQGYEDLIAGLNGYHNLPKAQKIGNFLLNNKKQIKEAVREKIFFAYCRQILEQKTYDLAKFPNNEAIAYWDAVGEKVFDLVADVDHLVTGIVVGSAPLSPGGPLNLPQKTILMEIIKKPWKRYSDAAKEHLLRLLIPYLKDAADENLNWGIEQIYSMLQKMEVASKLSEALQQEIISALHPILSKIKNELARRNAFAAFLFCDGEVVKKGGDVLAKMLNETEYQLGPGKDNALAFEAFLKRHRHFSLDEQIRLCGLYLGSSVFSESSSAKLIAKVKESLPITPSTPMNQDTVESEDTAPEEVVAEQTQEDYIEKYLLNISADDKAWTFFAKLFTELKVDLDPQLLREMASESIRKIKNEDEPLGVSRNRFSIINILKNEGYYSAADTDGLFGSLFSNDARAKIVLGCDFFETYFPNIDRIRDKNSRNSYKHAIKQALERWKDDPELTGRLEGLLD